MNKKCLLIILYVGFISFSTQGSQQSIPAVQDVLGQQAQVIGAGFGRGLKQNIGSEQSANFVEQLIRASGSALEGPAAQDFSRGVSGFTRETMGGIGEGFRTATDPQSPFRQGINAIFNNVILPNLAKVAGLGVATTAAYFSLKYGIPFALNYIEMIITKPTLVAERLSPHQITKNMDNLLYPQETKNQIMHVINTAKKVVENKNKARSYLHKMNPLGSPAFKMNFEHVMLFGPPGTGKTAVSQVIAKLAGMNFFRVPAGNFAKLQGKQLEQIDELFKEMRASKLPVLLFIDEMETLFGKRGQHRSEGSQNILTKIMEETGSPGNQIMIVGATNRPDDIDKAMKSRFQTKIKVGLPNKEARLELYKLYKDIYFNRDNAYTKDQIKTINTILSDEQINTVNSSIGAVAPRDIEALMLRIKSRSVTYNEGIPTQEIIDEVVKEKKAEIDAEKSHFE